MTMLWYTYTHQFWWPLGATVYKGPAPGALSDLAAVQRDQASAQCRGPLWRLKTYTIDHPFDTGKYLRKSSQMEKITILTYPVIDVCKMGVMVMRWWTRNDRNWCINFYYVIMKLKLMKNKQIVSKLSQNYPGCSMVICAYLGLRWPDCISLVTRVASTLMSQ